MRNSWPEDGVTEGKNSDQDRVPAEKLMCAQPSGSYLSVVCTAERSPVDSWLPTTASWRTARWTGARLASLKPSLRSHNRRVTTMPQIHVLARTCGQQRSRQLSHSAGVAYTHRKRVFLRTASSTYDGLCGEE